MNLKTNPNDSIFMDGNGMTKREYFAAMILSGLVSSSGGDGKLDASWDGKLDASWAVELADILIKKLNVQQDANKDVLE